MYSPVQRTVVCEGPLVKLRVGLGECALCNAIERHYPA